MCCCVFPREQEDFAAQVSARETVALGWPGAGGVRDLCRAQQPGQIQRKLNE